MQEAPEHQAVEVPHRAGFVSIVGKPNVGKSTLLNALLGFKLSIVTAKPQTTRHRILGILSGANHQLVFVDTPGIIEPKYGLHQRMMQAVDSAVAEADCVLLLVSPTEQFSEEEVAHRLEPISAPIVLAINKVDRSDPDEARKLIETWQERLPRIQATYVISALKKFNLDPLVQGLVAMLPESPAYFDKDQLTDRPERFFVTEIIREKIFKQYEQEIPYSTEVSILVYEERENLTYIDAEIHVERNTQKAILIGKQGQALREIGKAARGDIERFLERPVYLNLYVRVTEDWKNKDSRLRQFGY